MPQSLSLKDSDILKKQDEDSGGEATSSKLSNINNESEFERGKDKIMRMVMQNFKADNDNKIMYDGSSVGSSMTNHYTHRDTLKKIRLSIKSKSAPLNLKISMGLIAVGLFLCLLVNIICLELVKSSNGRIKAFIWDSKNATEALIKYNKMSTYIEYSKLVSNFSSTNTYQLIYTQNISTSIYSDINRTLNSMMELIDYIVTTTIQESVVSPIIQFSLYEKRRYYTQNTVKDILTLSYLQLTLNTLYSFIINGNGNSPTESYNQLALLQANRTISENENGMLQLNLDYYQKTLEIAAYMKNNQLVIGILDISLRTFIMIVCFGISIPMLYLSMEKSGEILQIISKISANNIAFYNNHYNKLISLLNNETHNVENTIEKVAESYRLGLKEKERKDKQNLSKRLKTTKEYDRKKSLWVVSGFFLFAFVMGLQSAKSSVSLVSMYDLASSVLAIIKIPNTINSYSAINMMTYKLLSYPVFNIEYDDMYNNGYILMKKVYCY